jgi:hypothetical protein
MNEFSDEKKRAEFFCELIKNSRFIRSDDEFDYYRTDDPYYSGEVEFRIKRIKQPSKAPPFNHRIGWMFSEN